MRDDTKKDSEQKADDKEPDEAEDGDQKGSTGTAAPADDDIIIK